MSKSSPYEVRLVRTQESELRPYLIAGGTPVVLANLWAEDLFRSFSLNTTQSYLRDVCIAFEWARTRGISLEEKFSHLTAFTPSEITSLSQRIGELSPDLSARQSTCARRLEAINSFIDFSFNHYIEIHKLSLIEQMQAEKNKLRTTKKLRKKVGYHIIQAEPPTPSTPLEQADIELLSSVSQIDHPENPFESLAIKSRNYCLVQVLLETLARRGEAVLIEMDDVTFGQEPTIRIKVPNRINQSKRKDGASLKTQGRVVPISQALAEALDEYINLYRDTLLVSKRPCTALFVSSRDGRRLSARSINTILNSLIKSPALRDIKARIHPHGLRSTAANRARDILERSPASNINVADALAYMGGWSQDSPMVRKYTRKSISDRLGKIVRKSKSVATK